MPLAALLAVLATLAPHAQEPAAPPPDAPCRIFGAFVDEVGAPIDGVTLSITGWSGNAERVKRFGLPRGWQNPAPVTTDDDGKLTLSFAPPRAFQFALEARAQGRGSVAWRWNGLEPGQELDLGVVTLVREAVLVGHILDVAGNLLVEDWVVSAWHGAVAGAGGRTSAVALSRIDPETGQFRIEGLPPGEWLVDASKRSERVEEIRVQTKVGEETFLELHHFGGDPRRRLFLTIRTRPFFVESPGPGAVHAIARDGTRHALTRVPGRVSEWHVPDIEPGPYRVEVRDPRFVDWTKETVRTGSMYDAHLVGSAALRVAVIDGATGAAVEDYDLDVGYRNPDLGARDVRVRERAVPSPAGGLYTGIVPGDLTVAVEAEGWPTARVDVDALAPGETRDVTVTMTAGTALNGRVVDAAGRPIAGVEVQVTRGEYPGHDRASAGESSASGHSQGKPFSGRIGYRDAATTTAADGSFTFEGLGRGAHALLALRGPMNDASMTVELPRAEPVVLTLADAALTTVRLRMPDGESPAGLFLELGSIKGQQPDELRRVRAIAAGDRWTCDEAGVFAARHLPLGTTAFDFMRVIEGRFGRSHEQVLRHEVALTQTGPQELELDLRESFPVRLTLHRPNPAIVPEAPWSLSIELTEEGAQRPTAQNTQGRTEGDRVVDFRWITPGVYRVEVRAPGLRWTRPEPVHVVRGAPNVFEVPVPLVGREVRVLGADGAPLANALVAYWTDSRERAVETTSADGTLVVVLLEGTLSLALPPQLTSTPAPMLGPWRGPRPSVVPAVLAGLTARATAAFGPGHGPLVLRMGPE